MKKKIGNYEIQEILGEGSFGIVKKAINTLNDEIVAIKILNKENLYKNNLLELLKKEVSIMRVIDHPNIIKLYEVLSSFSKIYLIVEYVENKDLLYHIRIFIRT